MSTTKTSSPFSRITMDLPRLAQAAKEKNLALAEQYLREGDDVDQRFNIPGYVLISEFILVFIFFSTFFLLCFWRERQPSPLYPETVFVHLQAIVNFRFLLISHRHDFPFSVANFSTSFQDFSFFPFFCNRYQLKVFERHKLTILQMAQKEN